MLTASTPRVFDGSLELSPFTEDRMHRIFSVLVSLLFACPAVAVTMARVVEIKDGRTIILEDRSEVRLCGVELTDELRARELLAWTIGSSWVMLERLDDGTARVYRSPDALFVNRELVLRGYARATLPGIAPPNAIVATYLGVVNPGPRVTTSAAPETRSGTSRRSPSPPKRAGGSRAARRRGAR